MTVRSWNFRLDGAWEEAEFEQIIYFLLFFFILFIYLFIYFIYFLFIYFLSYLKMKRIVVIFLPCWL